MHLFIFYHFELFVHRSNRPAKLRALTFIDPTGLDVSLDENEDME